MQIKTFAATLFITFAAALPGASTEGTERSEAVGAATDSTERSDAVGATPDVAETSTFRDGVAVSQKTWQADGHCEFKYWSLENCITRCIYEAKFGPQRCPKSNDINGNRTGGCLPFRDTCECTCTY